jgi:hypothetical protein
MQYELIEDKQQINDYNYVYPTTISSVVYVGQQHTQPDYNYLKLNNWMYYFSLNYSR